MRKALLLYNPCSGSRRDQRLANIATALTQLRNAGVETEADATVAGQTADQCRDAIARGYDTIFACGGDGTIHDVLQGIAGSSTALAIIPLGTANTLAHDLRLPLSAAEAARAAMSATPRRIAIGHIACRSMEGQSVSRYFTITAGIGLDGEVFRKLNAKTKTRLGAASYYLEGIKLWLTHPMHELAVSFYERGATEPLRGTSTQVLAVRIREFGGLLRLLAPGASLEQNDLRLVLFQTRSRIKYLAYALRGLMRANWRVPGIRVLNGTSIRCDATPDRTYVEADGEILGTLPAEITIVPDALTLLIP